MNLGLINMGLDLGFIKKGLGLKYLERDWKRGWAKAERRREKGKRRGWLISAQSDGEEREGSCWVVTRRGFRGGRWGI